MYISPYIEFDPQSGRHVMHFVNQQFDFLMTIYFDEAFQVYKFNCSDEEVRHIAKQCGRNETDINNWLAEANWRLPEEDAKRQ